MQKTVFTFLIVTCLGPQIFAQDVPQSKWRAVEIDKIKVGYGLKITDVNGDGKVDIVLADKKTVQWYESPTWTKHIIAENLTIRDNVCVAARDIDGDGKCEIAVGAQWNYRESTKDGAVFYLIPPEDRTKPWTPKQLYNDPSTHRMHWIRGQSNQYQLAVKPLRGRGSIEGDGPGLRVLEYFRPSNPNDEWKFSVVSDFMHLSHNFHLVNWDDDDEEEMIVACKEGVWHFDRHAKDWKATQLTDQFAGEIRDGKLPNGQRFIVTVEPKHGSKCAVYVQPQSQQTPKQQTDQQTKAADTLWRSLKVLDDQLKDGHALACADFLGTGSDQIVVGWRAMNDPGVPGIKLFSPLDKNGTQWRDTRISSAEVAVEDIKVADLNNDGKVDIIAAARQTKNLVIFFNETPSKN